MESVIKESFKKARNSKIHVIRYADDIVITASNKEILFEIKNILEEYLALRGLNIKQSKTRIININEGFDFLGWNIRKFPINRKKNICKKTREDILIVKPSKKNLKKVLTSIKDVLQKYKSLDVIIGKLNPILRGWAEYFRISSHSAYFFGIINSYVFKSVWKWLRKQYRYRTAAQLKKEYITSHNKYNWVFVSKTIDKKGNIAEKFLYQIASTKRLLLSLMKLDVNPYTLEGIEYFTKRKSIKAETSSREKIFKFYNYICPECGERLDNGEIIEIHHIVAKKEGGKNQYQNLMPLHQICHQKITFKSNKP